jgi:hypothetical protein
LESTTKIKHLYNKGDNDYYWIFMPDGTFYILPELLLMNNNNQIKKGVTLNERFKKYHYKPNDTDLLEKLKKLFK